MITPIKASEMLEKYPPIPPIKEIPEDIIAIINRFIESGYCRKTMLSSMTDYCLHDAIKEHYKNKTEGFSWEPLSFDNIAAHYRAGGWNVTSLYIPRGEDEGYYIYIFKIKNEIKTQTAPL